MQQQQSLFLFNFKKSHTIILTKRKLRTWNWVVPIEIPRNVIDSLFTRVDIVIILYYQSYYPFITTKTYCSLLLYTNANNNLKHIIIIILKPFESILLYTATVFLGVEILRIHTYTYTYRYYFLILSVIKQNPRIL